ncbi:hypothetical protein [Marivita sp.]|nr:hypothetical protein [Marivita sp.]
MARSAIVRAKSSQTKRARGYAKASGPERCALTEIVMSYVP